MYRSPFFVIRPSRPRPPLDLFSGVSRSQAAKSRPVSSCLAPPMAAKTADAGKGPTVIASSKMPSWIPSSSFDQALSRRAFFLRSLARRRTASAFLRLRISDGFSYARFALSSRYRPSRCILFLRTRIAWSTLFSRTNTCTKAPYSTTSDSGSNSDFGDFRRALDALGIGNITASRPITLMVTTLPPFGRMPCRTAIYGLSLIDRGIGSLWHCVNIQ